MRQGTETAVQMCLKPSTFERHICTSCFSVSRRIRAVHLTSRRARGETPSTYRRDAPSVGSTRGRRLSSRRTSTSGMSVSRRVSEGHLASGRATRDRDGGTNGARGVLKEFDGCAKRRKPPGRCLCFRTSAPVAEALPSLGASARFTSRAGRRFVDGERGRALALARSGFSSRHIHCYNNNSRVFSLFLLRDLGTAALY
jgi:hypothetical protein